MIADQALAMALDDPNAPQSLLEFANRIKDERIRRTLFAVMDAMKKSHRSQQSDARQGPTPTTSPLTSVIEAVPAATSSWAAESGPGTRQGDKPPMTLMICFIINGIVGLLIVAVSVSWFMCSWHP
jgi:hypothetical protein